LIGVRQHLEMFTRYLVATRSFYSDLPDTFCSSEALSAGNYDICWNGTALSAYVIRMGALKSRDLTSRDLTTRHHIARVDIARLVSVFE